MAATSYLGSNQDLNRFGSFVVTKSNPSGSVVRFTITDAAKLLTTTKMVRAVIMDAIAQWVASERADLISNGDQAVVDAVESAVESAGLPASISNSIAWSFENKRGDVTLTSVSSISTTGTLTAAAPFLSV